MILVAGLLVFTAPAAFPADLSPPMATEEGFRWSAFLGPFHLVLLHFPIGFIAAAAILEILTLRRRSDDLRWAVSLLLWMTLLSGAAASAAGLMRAEDGGFDPAMLAEHRNFAYVFLALTLATALTASFAHRPTAGRKLLLVHRGLFLFSVLLVGTAGHHGGNLTHGSEFLTQGAPPFLTRFLNAAPPAPAHHTAATNLASEGVNGVPATDPALSSYQTRIQPILKDRCYPCHGPEKHKGDYRLDTRDRALAAGDSGEPAIVPGDPMKSRLLKLLMLPREHDDAMPPAGKQALTAEEILAVAHWIQDGAPFTATANAAP